MSAWTLLARRADRSIAGILTGGSFTLTLRYNEVGSWSLNQPRERCPVDWPEPGCGVVFLHARNVIASGSWDEDSFEWTAAPGEDSSGAGQYTMTGDTDLGRIGYRLVYPSPGTSWTGGQGQYYTHPSQPAPAEGVMRRLVNYQAGSQALTARQVPGLRSFTSDTLGTNVTVRERFTPLLDALRKTAEAGGGLAFDVVDSLGGNIDLMIWQPRDLSTTVQFGVELGNVTQIAVKRVAPTGNAVLLAGGGELDARSLHEYGTPDPVWGRREVFLDQRQVGSDADAEAPTGEQQAEYDKAGEDSLAEGREQTAVSATVIDTETVQWGRDFERGDKVALLTPWGPVVDLVREVQINVDDKGVEEISSVIGTAEATTDDPLAKTVRDMSSRLSQLERGL